MTVRSNRSFDGGEELRRSGRVQFAFDTNHHAFIAAIYALRPGVTIMGLRPRAVQVHALGVLM
ncbi:hypothetical protein [Nocardia sp. NPDC056564]|uniref:hypothetical protein n=1 Tax=Nocardia sp. NPDC056564 TaxID=3345865 RepID=UPI00366E95AF